MTAEPTALRPVAVDPLAPYEDEAALATLLLTYSHVAVRDDALAAVDPADFANPHLGALWAAGRRLAERGERITRRALLSEKDGGKASAERALADLDRMVPPIADMPRIIDEVRRCARLRAVVQAADEIRHRAMTAEDGDQALTWAMDRLTEIDTGTPTPEVRRWAALLDDWQHAITNPGEQHWIIPTPWSDINDVIAGGLHGGRVYVIGARPGQGKSIAAHRIAVHAAEQGQPAGVFSMEMGAFEVTGRMVAGAARIELAEISRRELTRDSFDRLDRWMPGARDWPLWVNDKPGVTVNYIKQVCRAEQRRNGLRVVAVDYLQLVNPADRSRSREQQVAEVSRQLKLLARELDVAVILPAQLNRGPAGRAPMLSDLRESGAIEADADVVMLLARGVQLDDQGNEVFDGTLNVELAKNRHGPVRGMSLAWSGGYASIG